MGLGLVLSTVSLVIWLARLELALVLVLALALAWDMVRKQESFCRPEAGRVEASGLPRWLLRRISALSTVLAVVKPDASMLAWLAAQAVLILHRRPHRCLHPRRAQTTPPRCLRPHHAQATPSRCLHPRRVQAVPLQRLSSGKDATHVKWVDFERKILAAVWVVEGGELAPVVSSRCAAKQKRSGFGVFSRPLSRSTSRPWCCRRMIVVAGSSRRRGEAYSKLQQLLEEECSDHCEYPLQLCEALAGLASAQSVDAALARFEAGGRRLRRPPPL
ncbi:hypothetical protein DFH08DRAFT_806275 [Mycena albidolilacea]|uniref:Uncharacterized protein n=1 Tax=Mycena albidolilacea TaxID=1033008 RepID=A0AAD7A8Z6_9AGAR|nr:hypothetical protein DFH08DRAFT_806275 [Mycena albidolilacea]